MDATLIYADHKAISYITHTYYALFYDEPVIMSNAVKHLKHTLNDCVVEALEHDLEIQLLELNCNVHQLDGIAKKYRDVVNE